MRSCWYTQRSWCSTVSIDTYILLYLFISKRQHNLINKILARNRSYYSDKDSLLIFGTSASDMDSPLVTHLLLPPSRPTTAGTMPTPWQKRRIAWETLSGHSSRTLPTSFHLRKLTYRRTWLGYNEIFTKICMFHNSKSIDVKNTLSLAFVDNAWLSFTLWPTYSELSPTRIKISQLKYFWLFLTFLVSLNYLSFFLICSDKSFLFMKESTYRWRFLKPFCNCFLMYFAYYIQQNSFNTLDWYVHVSRLCTCWPDWAVCQKDALGYQSCVGLGIDPRFCLMFDWLFDWLNNWFIIWLIK